MRSIGVSQVLLNDLECKFCTLHPGVADGSVSTHATVVADGHRSRTVELVPGPQRIVLSDPSTLTIRLGGEREHESRTIELVGWSRATGMPIRVLPTSGSPQSGVMTFSLEHPGPWSPRWVGGGRAWNIGDPSATGNVYSTYWLEIPEQGLEIGLGELALEILGSSATLMSGNEPAVDAGGWAKYSLNWPEVVIGGGTPNIQKNIIAERILGLPKD